VPLPAQVHSLQGPTYFAPAGPLGDALGHTGWLLPGILHLGHVYTLTAKPSAGKTSVMALLAACVQGGTPFAGIETKRGQVLYGCADDPYGLLDRLKLLAGDGLPDAADVWVSAHAFDVTSEEVQAQLLALVDELGEIRLIVLDTVLYYTPSSIESENDNLGLARFLAAARELTKLPGRPCILVLCHPRKGALNEADELIPRGGSAVLAACDGNLALWNEDGLVTLHHSAKMRGGFDELHFALDKGVQIGELVDEDGLAVRTVRVRAMDAAGLAELQQGELDSQAQALAWLQGREAGEWVGSGAIELALNLSKRQVQRLLQGLVEIRRVRTRGQGRATVYQAVARK
jgi:hypothetical protein